MPTTPDPSRPRRSKAKLTEQALADRLASSLDPSMIATESAPQPRPAASKPVAKTAPRVPPGAAAKDSVAAARFQLFEAGIGRLTGAVSSAQEIARDTARSLADSRLLAARSVVAFQKKLLEMVHTNLHDGFAAARKIVAAPNVGEAIKVQSSFAETRIKALSDQAAELRSLSARLAKESQEPWAAHMAKSLGRMKTGLSA